MFYIRNSCKRFVWDYLQIVGCDDLVDLSTRWVRHPWWSHQMETFSALLAICAGNSPVTGEFPTRRPVTRSFEVFFDLRLNERLIKKSWGWWFATPLRPLCRHSNDYRCGMWKTSKSIADHGHHRWHFVACWYDKCLYAFSFFDRNLGTILYQNIKHLR